MHKKQSSNTFDLGFISILKKSEVLQGLTDQQLIELLNDKEIITYQEDDVIFEQNSLDNDLYIILSGSVDLLLDPEAVCNVEKGTLNLYPIATIGPGNMFGELSLFDGRPRSASAHAAEDNTQLLLIPAETFNEFLYNNPSAIISRLVLNIIKNLTYKLRNTNITMIGQMLTTYFIKTLVEDLLVTHYECTIISPLKRQFMTQQNEYFVLNRFTRLESKKEIIDTYFFADVATIKSVMGLSSPNGEVILNTLLSIIRTGQMPSRVNSNRLTFELDNENDTRSGELIIRKESMTYSIRWQLKGIIQYDTTLYTYANLFLYISNRHAKTVQDRLEEMVERYEMPIQKHICSQLNDKIPNAKNYRVMVIHHRTHEVASTLKQLDSLGFLIDSVIGIPYGDASWEANLVLNQTSNQQYFSLKTITHAKKPTKYVFDFKSSSFLDIEVERELITLFSDPKIHFNYMEAMYSLFEYCFVKTAERCLANNEKLIVYEDGGYTYRLFQIYHDENHPLYPLVQQLIHEGILVGVVEGTMSGERKHRQYLSERNHQALVPVLSSARSQLKTLFESKGIAESIIHSTSTALGRIGLPTFQQRCIALIGGNGVIGRRIVEQIVNIHNGTQDVIIVDTNKSMQQENLSSEYSLIADRLEYKSLHQYPFDEDAVYVWFPKTLSDSVKQIKASPYYKTIQTFLQPTQIKRKLMLMNCTISLYNSLHTLLTELCAVSNITYEVKTHENNVIEYLLLDNLNTKSIVLVPENTVLCSNIMSKPIIECVDTIIGVTGYSVLTAMDIVNFLLRSSPNEGQTDQLMLASGSSKDYEFKHCIEFLDTLLYVNKSSLQQSLHLKPDVERYQEELGLLLSQKFDDFNQVYTTLSTQIQVDKHIHSDVGTTYNIEVNGQHKFIHLLANGMVINFFAKHEKGAKSEYIDPIVTLQLLSVVRYALGPSLQPGLYDAAQEVGDDFINYIWYAINQLCKPFTER